MRISDHFITLAYVLLSYSYFLCKLAFMLFNFLFSLSSSFSSFSSDYVSKDVSVNFASFFVVRASSYSSDV